MESFKPPCPLRKSHFSVRTASFFCRAGLDVSHLGSGSIQPKIDASRLESTYLPLDGYTGIPFNTGNYSLRNPIKRDGWKDSGLLGVGSQYFSRFMGYLWSFWGLRWAYHQSELEKIANLHQEKCKKNVLFLQKTKENQVTWCC